MLSAMKYCDLRAKNFPLLRKNKSLNKIIGKDVKLRPQFQSTSRLRSDKNSLHLKSMSASPTVKNCGTQTYISLVGKNAMNKLLFLRNCNQIFPTNENNNCKFGIMGRPLHYRKMQSRSEIKIKEPTHDNNRWKYGSLRNQLKPPSVLYLGKNVTSTSTQTNQINKNNQRSKTSLKTMKSSRNHFRQFTSATRLSKTKISPLTGRDDTKVTKKVNSPQKSTQTNSVLAQVSQERQLKSYPTNSGDAGRINRFLKSIGSSISNVCDRTKTKSSSTLNKNIKLIRQNRSQVMKKPVTCESKSIHRILVKPHLVSKDKN